MSYIHKNLASGRWFKLSLYEQMANIGVEVDRTINWRNKDKTSSIAAFERASELIDLSLADPKHRGRYKEFARAREVVCDFFVGDNDYQSTPESLDHYFYSYNYAARRNR